MIPKPEYPLTAAEARAALVNEPPGTIIESEYGQRWMRKSENWSLSFKGIGAYWDHANGVFCGPSLKSEGRFRIIALPKSDPAEEAAPINPTFFMVYADGRRGPAVKHESKEKAEDEAKRVALLEGVKTHVLQCVSSFVVSAVVTREEPTP